MRLYTIPYAGGFSFTFLKWKRYLDCQIKLHPIEFPGRGSKVHEPLCLTIEQMAEDIYPEIDTFDNNYTLFGHSMGGYVLIQLYEKLRERNKPLPKHIILSGMKPPHLYVSGNEHLLNDEEFKEKMIALGGLPEEILKDEEFTEYILRLLRNDFKAIESYEVTNQLILTSQVSLFNSTSDISYETISEWNQYTAKTCDYYEFEGSHFFINENASQVVSKVNQILAEQY